jgi:OHCU decarboxylase
MSVAETLNRMDEAALRAALTRCCAARAWVEAMVAAGPFADDGAWFAAAESAWWQRSRDDWLEAFAAHPLIGDMESLRAKYADTRTLASGEQAGVQGASEGVLRRLAELNREYRQRFGYIFIVFATGKSADEMLALLESRLPNDAETELKIAAAEQWKITRLRLHHLAEPKS